MKKGSRRGCFSLKGAIIGIDDQDDSTFTIRVQDRTFHFQGTIEDDIYIYISIRPYGAGQSCINRTIFSWHAHTRTHTFT